MRPLTAAERHQLDTLRGAPVAAGWKVGDVILDSYANPAVVIQLDHNGRPRGIMQTVGSDLGHIASAPPGALRHRIADEGRAEAARERARAEWRKRPGLYRIYGKGTGGGH